MADANNIDFDSLRVDLQRARDLFSDVLKATDVSDQRSKAAGAPWHKRHRLHVLLEAAQRIIAARRVSARDLTFATEMVSTVRAVEKWRNDEAWEFIESSLVNEYSHTVHQIHIAEYLKQENYNPKFVKTAEHPTPDLQFWTLDKNYPVYVEIYNPSILQGKTHKISASEATKIIKKAISKAKGQLGPKRIGMIAICGFNQSQENLSLLTEAAEGEMKWQLLPSFAGFIIASIGAVFTATPNTIESKPIISVDVFLNEQYFGPVTFQITPRKQADSIKENFPLVLATSEDIHSFPIIHSSGRGVPPFFLGKGNVNYLCANCGIVLIESAWKTSLNQLIIECPTCKALCSVFAKDAALANKLVLKGSHFYFSGPAYLKQGISLWGN